MEKVIEIKYNDQISRIYPKEGIPDSYIDSLLWYFKYNVEVIVPVDIDAVPWVYCLVGNIVDVYKGGPGEEVRRGTKHFAPGAKVYCFPARWDDGYRSVLVMGQPRRGPSMIKVVVQRKYIHNFRLTKVYNRDVIKEMYYSNGWDNSEKTRDEITGFADYLNGGPQGCARQGVD
jgi:hypothetical protein